MNNKTIINEELRKGLKDELNKIYKETRKFLKGTINRHTGELITSEILGDTHNTDLFKFSVTDDKINIMIAGLANAADMAHQTHHELTECIDNRGLGEYLFFMSKKIDSLRDSRASIRIDAKRITRDLMKVLNGVA